MSESIQGLHNREWLSKRKQAPVWPFNAVSFRRFLGVLFTPLLAAIISAIVNLIFSL